jgi:hypothetical protein
VNEVVLIYPVMLYFFMKGLLWEHCHGSRSSALLLGIISVSSSVVYITLRQIMAAVMDDLYYMQPCGIGFSGIVFTLNVMTSYEIQSREKFIVNKNVTNVGIGGILSQLQDRQEQVTAYYSKMLNKDKKNYSIAQQQLLAILRAL